VISTGEDGVRRLVWHLCARCTRLLRAGARARGPGAYHVLSRDDFPSKVTRRARNHASNHWVDHSPWRARRPRV